MSDREIPLPPGMEVSEADEDDVCEWCGYSFYDNRGGRFECRTEAHIPVGCGNCGACLHASHGGAR